MYLNYVFELSMVLDNEKFHNLLTRVCKQTEYLNDHKYIDQTLSSKGIVVTYQDKQYKKKVQITINSNVMLEGGDLDSGKLIHKLERCVHDYFGSICNLNDFNLKRMIFMADIDVGSRAKVSAYIKVLQKIGKVKGFSPLSYDCMDADIGFCLDGNSNGIQFLIYDLEGLLASQFRKNETNHKKMKSIIKNSEGILRAEIRLTQPKTVRAYTDENDTSKQLAVLLENSREIFLATFVRVVPFGAFYKKDMAVEIIQREVKNMTFRRRMLRLVALVPEKKSLLLAQKALNYRKVDDVMKTFAKINVSPITISKRHDVKHLKCLYYYLDENNDDDRQGAH
ncbi:hypothetical protein [Sporomusa acidovorans]|uniref:Uncharacterized protein n=1 Tax=Sporomusa acidovorans (strain ATCC 49682 / DSM 3132 / Mol) TaxID=1123286 RepID=A0ABZ3IZA9_SPOA4|nr:hypothetical protein [Sporomusa acidovorans]OZC19213.1 hypothetical protein SPACI_32990 [Sporomusa acidovorans DSM 3132]SDF10750.1 hypothetical protein SAMN04488499_10335 [Sporomusa acidovorans]